NRGPHTDSRARTGNVQDDDGGERGYPGHERREPEVVPAVRDLEGTGESEDGDERAEDGENGLDQVPPSHARTRSDWCTLRRSSGSPRARGRRGTSPTLAHEAVRARLPTAASDGTETRGTFAHTRAGAKPT